MRMLNLRPLLAAAPLLLALAGTASAQTVLRGTVRDSATSRPVSGVQVRVLELRLGAATDTAGRYVIRVPAEGATRGRRVTVQARRVGYETRSRRLELAGDSVAADFTLVSSSVALDALVVTGTASSEAVRAEDFSGSGKVGAVPAVVEGRAPGAVVAEPPAPPMVVYSPPAPPEPAPVPIPAPPTSGASERSAASAPGTPARTGTTTLVPPESGSRTEGWAEESDTTAVPPEAGILTAAVNDDFDERHWPHYLRFLQRTDDVPWNQWRLDPRRAVRIRFGDRGTPLRDHPVTVRQGERVYEMRTGPDGEIRLFPDLEHRLETGRFTVTPRGGREQTLALPAASEDGEHAQLSARGNGARVRTRPVLDVGFLIDATGSMGDEMEYLKTELRDIIERMIPEEAGLEVRVSVVYYRDRGDEFLTRAKPFGVSLDSTLAFLRATGAGGGGDWPEDVNSALQVMMAHEWIEGPAARILFLLADAPPQMYADAQYTYHDAIRQASSKGIAIFPIAASGATEPMEYLMRAMAVMTGGKYIWLTDDSGVGNAHATPDVPPFKVEELNELMVREIRQYAAMRFPELRLMDENR